MASQERTFAETLRTRLKEDPFPVTRWSIIAQAGENQTAAARNAWSELFQTYWLPLYSYVRRRGYSPEEAEDLTQSFFAKISASGMLSKAQEDKGKLRCFLLTAIKNFCISWHRKETAQKRRPEGGMLALEFEVGEQRLSNEPFHDLTPELEFERRWALQLVEESLKELSAEFAAKGKTEQFEAFSPHLCGDAEIGDHAALAEKLGIKSGAVRIAVYRARQRFGQILRSKLTDTVASEQDVDSEIDHLLTLFQA